MANVLLVDDDDSLRKMLCIRLLQMGHKVMEAHGVEDALNLVRKSVPGVVITDIIMPEKQGLDIIRHFHTQHPHVKIVAMSGGARGSPTGYLKMANAMGADHVLAKPFSNEQLAATLIKLCGSTEVRLRRT